MAKPKFSPGDKVKHKEINIRGVVTHVWTNNPSNYRYTIVTRWGSQVIHYEIELEKD